MKKLIFYTFIFPNVIYILSLYLLLRMPALHSQTFYSAIVSRINIFAYYSFKYSQLANQTIYNIYKHTIITYINQSCAACPSISNDIKDIMLLAVTYCSSNVDQEFLQNFDFEMWALRNHPYTFTSFYINQYKPNINISNTETHVTGLFDGSYYQRKIQQQTNQ